MATPTQNSKKVKKPKLSSQMQSLLNKGLEEWQQKLVHHAMLDEYIYGAKKNATQFVSDVAETIGECISNDWITRHANGINYYRDNQIIKFHPESLRKIVTYLIHKSIGRLTKKHFERSEPSHLAPTALIQFIGGTYKENGSLNFGYGGSFIEDIKTKSDDQSVIELLFEPSSNYGYYRITEIIMKKAHKVRKEDYQNEKNNSLPVNISEGWAIESPDKRLIIFLSSRSNDFYNYVNISPPVRFNQSGRIVGIELLHNRNMRITSGYPNDISLEDCLVHLTRT